MVNQQFFFEVSRADIGESRARNGVVKTEHFVARTFFSVLSCRARLNTFTCAKCKVLFAPFHAKMDWNDFKDNARTQDGTKDTEVSDRTIVAKDGAVPERECQHESGNRELELLLGPEDPECALRFIFHECVEKNGRRSFKSSAWRV